MSPVNQAFRSIGLLESNLIIRPPASLTQIGFQLAMQAWQLVIVVQSSVSNA